MFHDYYIGRRPPVALAVRDESQKVDAYQACAAVESISYGAGRIVSFLPAQFRAKRESFGAAVGELMPAEQPQIDRLEEEVEGTGSQPNHRAYRERSRGYTYLGGTVQLEQWTTLVSCSPVIEEQRSRRK